MNAGHHDADHHERGRCEPELLTFTLDLESHQRAHLIDVPNAGPAE